MTFGGALDWSRLDITVVDIAGSESFRPEIGSLTGDACCMKQFDDLSFDFVHSNSVIEHLAVGMT
jgi:hypothetical protein